MKRTQQPSAREEILSRFEKKGVAVSFPLSGTDEEAAVDFRLDEKLDITGAEYILHDQLDHVIAAIAAKYPDDPIIHFSSTPLLFSDHWHDMANSDKPYDVPISHRPHSNESTLRDRTMLWIRFRKEVFWIEVTNPPLQKLILEDRLAKFHANDISEQLRQVSTRIDRIRALRKEVMVGEWPRLLIVEIPNKLPSDYSSYCCSRRFSESVQRIIGKDASPVHFVYHPESVPYSRQTFNSHWDAVIEAGNGHEGWPSDITKPDDVLTRTAECAAFNDTQLQSFESKLEELHSELAEKARSIPPKRNSRRRNVSASEYFVEWENAPGSFELGPEGNGWFARGDIDSHFRAQDAPLALIVDEPMHRCVFKTLANDSDVTIESTLTIGLGELDERHMKFLALVMLSTRKPQLLLSEVLVRFLERNPSLRDDGRSRAAVNTLSELNKITSNFFKTIVIPLSGKGYKHRRLVSFAWVRGQEHTSKLIELRDIPFSAEQD